MEMCLLSVFIRELQIKTIIWFYFSSNISIEKKNEFIRKKRSVHWEKTEPSYTASGSEEIVFPFLENSIIVYHKVLKELPHSQAVSLLGIY